MRSNFLGADNTLERYFSEPEPEGPDLITSITDAAIFSFRP